MHSNETPHIHPVDDRHLKTGGSLKDGWSYLMPQDNILLYQEVTSAFADELDPHVKEQTNALKNLYLKKNSGGGSFLLRKDSDVITSSNDGEKLNDNNTLTFFIQRGLQVVGCVSYDNEKAMISDLVVRPSAAKDDTLQKELIGTVIEHAKKEGKEEVFIHCDDSKHIPYYEELGPCERSTVEGFQMIKLSI